MTHERQKAEIEKIFLNGSTSMGQMMHSFDWTASRLGSVEGWSQSLRIALQICLQSPLPMAIWWGKDLVLLYNDAWCFLLGDKHPSALGRSPKEISLKWDIISEIEQVLETGQATTIENLKLSIFRHGISEEVYLTLSHSLINDDASEAGGVLTTVTAIATAKEKNNRLETLAELERAKTLLFSNLGRELEPPIASILTPIEKYLNSDRREQTSVTPLDGQRDGITDFSLDTILESITEAFVTVNSQWQYTYLNSEAERLMRRCKKEVIGKTIWEVFPDLVSSIVDRELHKAINEQISVQFEVFYEPYSQWFETRAYPFKEGLTIYFLDISARKQAEDELQQAYQQLKQQSNRSELLNAELQTSIEELQVTEEELRQQHEQLAKVYQTIEIERERYLDLFNFAPDGYLVTDKNGIIQEANQAIAYYLSQEQNLLIGTPLAVYIAFSGRQVFRELLLQLHQQSQLQTEELELITTKKVSIPVSITVSAIRNSEQQLVGVRWLIQDISERKRIEAALRENEERYRSIFDTSGVSIWEEDFTQVEDFIEEIKAKGVTNLRKYLNAHPEEVQKVIKLVKICNVNAYTLQLFGANNKTELLNSLTTVFTLATSDIFIEEIVALAEGRRYFQAETVLQTSQGKPRQVLFNLTFPAPGAKYNRTIVSLLDISEQKQTEAALYQSEERLQMAIKAARMVTWSWDTKSDRTIYSHTACEILGLTPEKLNCTSQESWNLVHPDDLLRHQAIVNEAFTHKRRYISEFRIIRPDNGAIIWVQDRGKASFDETDNLISAEGALIDITSRKQAEKALLQSQEKFHQLAEAMPQIVWINNAKGELEYANQQWYNYSGLTFEQSHKRSLMAKVIHPDDRESFFQQWDFCQETETPYQIECRLRRAEDGAYRWFLTRALPIRDEKGKLVRWYGTSTDIDDRKQIEIALRQSESRFRHLAESNIIGVVIAKFNGSISYANDAYLKLVGYSREELKRGELRWSDITPPEYLDRDRQGGEEILETGICQPYEKEYLLRDGTRIPVLVGGARIDSSEDMIAFAIDIRDRKRIEAQREQLLKREQAAREELERANRIKDEFLAILSHELRSPLNAIVGWSNLLRSRQYDEATIARGLETIERNALLQTQLIEDLLDVSRILRGKLALNFSSLNLAPIIEAAINTMRPTAQVKSIEIQTAIEPDVGLVSCDPARIQQIIWNLLSNAIKFTPSGGRVEVRLEKAEGRGQRAEGEEKEEGIRQKEEMEISPSPHPRVTASSSPRVTASSSPPLPPSPRVTASSSAPYAQITISDTGKGISPDFLPHVFEYFRQADGSITRQHGGLGLGLAIVRHLVEQHGGEVMANSLGEGQGATFTVRLPLILNPSVTSQNSESSRRAIALNDIRVLVIDDEQDSRDLLTFALQQYGAIVTSVTSAKEVIKAIEQFKPHILVSDIGMPQEDGYRLMQRLRSSPDSAIKNLPAIALTAYAREEDRQQAIKAGFQLHLSKPVDAEALAMGIFQIIGSRLL